MRPSGTPFVEVAARFRREKGRPLPVPIDRVKKHQYNDELAGVTKLPGVGYIVTDEGWPDFVAAIDRLYPQETETPAPKPRPDDRRAPVAA